MVIGVLSVVGVAAATFGKPYQPQRQGVQYAQNYHSEMPRYEMGSTGSVMMKSGSALPMAAVSGTTTANDYAAARLSSRPRRIVGDDDEGGEGIDENGRVDEDPIDMTDPDVPVGDAAWPLMICAAVFSGVIALRRKRAMNG